jgi:hypothetical protein
MMPGFTLSINVNKSKYEILVLKNPHAVCEVSCTMKCNQCAQKHTVDVHKKNLTIANLILTPIFKELRDEENLPVFQDTYSVVC